MPSATMTSKGQITVPKEIRDKLNLGTSDRVEFLEDPDGGYRLVPGTRDIRELKGSLPPPREPVSVEEMNRAIARANPGRAGPAGKQS